MGSTHANILLHIVFSTKGRAPVIDEDLRERLYSFIGGVVRANKGIPVAIGGMPDHIHLLVRWNTSATVARLMQDVKGGSSRWIHETFPDRRQFAWQGGYGVFSVSQSQSERVIQYIDNQADHHRNQNFKDEFRQLLAAHGVEFDEAYIWD